MGTLPPEIQRRGPPKLTTTRDSWLTYLLDTNACIAQINGKPAAVCTRFHKAVEGAQVNVSTIVAFQLWYGVAK